ncbi:MAG: hypothetical protein Q9157_001093 [Trypethelium eluteriae]
MAGTHRTECRPQNASREDSAWSVAWKRAQSTIVTSVNPSSKNTICSTAATDDGKSNKRYKSAKPVQEPMPVDASTQSQTNKAGGGNVDPPDSGRHSILGLRKALSRTRAFVKEVCQADISEARGVNAYLDKSRSRDGEGLNTPVDFLSVEEVEAARKEWLAFSCSNTPGNRTPVEERGDPLAAAQIGQPTLGLAGGQTETITNQTPTSEKRQKIWWKIRKGKADCTQTSASATSSQGQPFSPRQPLPSFSAAQTPFLKAPGPSNWFDQHFPPDASGSPLSLPQPVSPLQSLTPKSRCALARPSDSSSLSSLARPLTYDPSLLSSLFAATRAHYRAHLLERYAACLPCRMGKRSSLHLLRTPSPSWDANWALVPRELEAESAALDRWEQDCAKWDSKSVFGRRGRKGSNVVGPRPKTSWLDGVEEGLRLANERGGFEGLRTKPVCAWIQAYVRVEKARREKHERQKDSKDACCEDDCHVDDHENEDDDGGLHEGEEDRASDNEDTMMGPTWIEDLVEDCAFDALARTLKDDLQLVQWVFNSDSPCTDHEKGEDRVLLREIDQVIKKTQGEWFTSVFVQPACPRDGQRAEIPARVFKIISKKAERRVKRRARGSSRRQRKNNGETSEMAAQRHMEDAAGEKEEQVKQQEER